MSARKQKTLNRRQQKVCILCQRVEADPGICGEKVEVEDLCVHEYCTVFASELYPRRVDENGTLSFLTLAVRIAVFLAEEKECFVCHQGGATITCWQRRCGRSFHLPCSTQGECVTQDFGYFCSFCGEHRPQQTVEVPPEKTTMCLLCTDLVDETKSYRTMVCPACQHAWFHRECIQGYALSAGTSCFRCPLCRDTIGFKEEMLRMGIRIPYRPPRWEEVETFPALGQRHSRCDASQCLCPGGREQEDNEGPWELLLCCSCAAEGTHRRCSHLAPGTDNWECQICAGPITAASASSEIDGPSTSSQLPSGASASSPELNSSRRSSHPGPVWVRIHSRLQRRSQTPYEHPSRRQENSWEPAAAADTSTHGQAALKTCHCFQDPDSSSPSSTSRLPSEASSSSPELDSSSSCSSPPGPLRL